MPCGTGNQSPSKNIFRNTCLNIFHSSYVNNNLSDKTKRDIGKCENCSISAFSRRNKMSKTDTENTSIYTFLDFITILFR